MKNDNLSALDVYTNRVYRIIVLIIPVFCLCASATITILHHIGWYSDINETAMWLFVLSNVFYFVIGLYFLRTGFGEDGLVKPQKLKMAKYVMAVITIIQWNGISYIWPFTDFWAYAVLFVIVSAFFFDSKLVIFSTTGILISMFLSWYVKGGRLFPPQDEYFEANMTFRGVGLFLMLLSINLITYFGGKFFIEELEKYVNYDTLTHLLNRRSMNGYLENAYKKAKMQRIPFSLLLMDIDEFKKINDNYGHDCGDEVLKSVAQIISRGVKQNDSVFRWGGEEILVLLETNEQQAVDVAERIRKDVENLTINYRGELSISVTITVGVTSYTDVSTVQQMMDDVDAKLYYGKRHGRNQVVSVLPARTSEPEEEKNVC